MKQSGYEMNDLDYVEIYAKRLKEDNSYFKQQKGFIESQFKSSHCLFNHSFGKGQNFKRHARQYLRERGLLK